MVCGDAKMSMRLERWLAQYGGLSRSEAIKLIRRKMVTINGVVCNVPKQQVQYRQCVFGRTANRGTTIPAGLPQTDGYDHRQSDPHGRSCVGDWLPHRYHIVGRLDLDTRTADLFQRWTTHSIFTASIAPLNKNTSPR